MLRLLDIPCKRRKLNPYLIPYTKINSKWVRDISIKVKSLTFLEENMHVNICDLRLLNGFLNMAPKPQALEEKQVNWTLSKLKNVYASKEINKM